MLLLVEIEEIPSLICFSKDRNKNNIKDWLLQVFHITRMYYVPFPFLTYLRKLKPLARERERERSELYVRIEERRQRQRHTDRPTERPEAYCHILAAPRSLSVSQSV